MENSLQKQINAENILQFTQNKGKAKKASEDSINSFTIKAKLFSQQPFAMKPGGKMED